MYGKITWPGRIILDRFTLDSQVHHHIMDSFAANSPTLLHIESDYSLCLSHINTGMKLMDQVAVKVTAAESQARMA